MNMVDRIDLINHFYVLSSVLVIVLFPQIHHNEGWPLDLRLNLLQNQHVHQLCYCESTQRNPSQLFTTGINSQVNASVFTLLAMTLERYRAIMTPLAPRQSHGTLWTAIALIWFVVVSFPFPARFKHLDNEKQSNVPGLEELSLLSPLLSTQRSTHLLVGNK